MTTKTTTHQLNVDASQAKNVIKDFTAKLKKITGGPQAQQRNSRKITDVLKQQSKLQLDINKALEKQNKLLEKNIKLQERSAKLAKQHGGGGIGGTPPRRPPGGGGGGPSPSGGGGRGTPLGVAGRGAAVAGFAATIGAALVSTLVGAIRSQISSGYQAYLGYGRSRAALGGAGLLQGSIVSRGGDSVATGAFAAGRRMGFSATETVQQARGVGRSTGNINAVGLAQRGARLYGGDVSEVAGFMGNLTRGGATFRGGTGTAGTGNRMLQRVLTQAVRSGLDRSRTGEFLQTVGTAVNVAAARTAGNVDAAQYGGLMAYFGKRGGEGFRGARGMQIMQGFDQAIAGAGQINVNAGDTQAAILQAYGYGTPGGGASLLEATSRAQQGVFGSGGARNLMDMLNRFAEMGGGMQSDETIYTLSGVTRLPIEVMKKVTEIVAAGGDRDEILTAIQEETEKALPIEKQAAQAVLENVKVARQMAAFQDRLVDIGEKSYDSIVSIQTSINRVVTEFINPAIALLQTIAGLLEQITGWLFGDEVTFSDVSKNMSAADRELMGESGSVEDYRKKITATMAEANQAVTHAQKYGNEVEKNRAMWQRAQVAKRLHAVDESALSGVPESLRRETASVRIMGADSKVLKGEGAQFNRDFSRIVLQELLGRAPTTQEEGRLVGEVARITRALYESGEFGSIDVAQFRTIVSSTAMAQIGDTVQVTGDGGSP
jgi:hypothetical protein